MTEQSILALAAGNEIRQKMSALKRRIAALPYDEGCEFVGDLLLDPDLPVHIDAMRVDALLGAIHHVGTYFIARIRNDADFHRRDVRIRDLTHHERARLAEALGHRARKEAS